MDGLPARLQAAIEHSGATQAELARVCGISTAAVSKWFSGRTRDLRLDHLFAVADRCQVDGRWLATGRGKMLPTGVSMIAEPSAKYSVISRERIDVLRLYERLPDDARVVVKRLLHLLAR
jgi:transcriptional regulator with XRE-family HTH domain